MIKLAAIGHAHLISVYVIWLGLGAVFELVENKASLISVCVISVQGSSLGTLWVRLVTTGTGRGGGSWYSVSQSVSYFSSNVIAGGIPWPRVRAGIG